jgi:molybdopterin-synthase adenylyltransferase
MLGLLVTMKRPRLKRTTEQIETPNGDLLLLWPSGGGDIHIENPGDEDRRLLDALDGRRERGELGDRFGERAVSDLLAQLAELGLLEDAADDDLIRASAARRFDRQLRYFSDITAGPTPSECQARLEEARIVVLGVGGLGGCSALSLAGCGVGEMLLIDGDRVEESNLNRQYLYGESDVGRLKVDAAVDRLSGFNSEIRIGKIAEQMGGEAAIAEAIEGYDLVIDAADWPIHEIEEWVNGACFAAGIPFITMSHFPPVARVGPLFVPGVTGCFRCQLAGHRRSYPAFDLVMEQRRKNGNRVATMGPACNLIGGQVGMDVMHHLTGLVAPSTLGVGHIYDLRTMEVERDSVVPEPDCPVCGHLTSAPPRNAALGATVGS